jgi:hypothetical protein
MAGQGQFKRATAARWNSVNPILAAGEIGLEGTLVNGKFDFSNLKIGNGIDHWNDLSYQVLNIQGEKGDTGTGLSRQTAETIDFGNEDNYVEKTISDDEIEPDSVIIIQIVGDNAPEYLIQGVQFGIKEIIEDTSYTIYAIAPDGASGVMSINILIF